MASIMNTWNCEAELTADDLTWLHSLDIATSICRRMDELGLTKGELARRAGMKASALSRIIAGKQNLTLASIAKLEIALGIRFDGGFLYQPEGNAGVEAVSSLDELGSEHNDDACCDNRMIV